MVALGFDCSDATFMELGLNVCGWGRKADIPNRQFNLLLSLSYLPKGMAESFYEKDGYDFMPGDLVYADSEKGRRTPVDMNFDLATLDPQRSHELTFEAGKWTSIERSWPVAWDTTRGDWKMAVVVEGQEVAFRVAVGSGPDGAAIGFSQPKANFPDT